MLSAIKIFTVVSFGSKRCLSLGGGGVCYVIYGGGVRDVRHELRFASLHYSNACIHGYFFDNS